MNITILKKLTHGLVAAGLTSVVFTSPSAIAANPNQAPNKPSSPTSPTQADHDSDLAGTITYDGAGQPTGALTGTITLEVDQSGVTAGPIVFANLNLPANFSWGGDETVSVTSDEGVENVEVTGYIVSLSGTQFSVSGLNMTDTDGDFSVEFSITVSTDVVGISTTQVSSGEYGVSSQYRTNSSRKVKAQSWVLSTPAMIDLTVTHPVTWDDEGAETPSSGGSATYTTGSAVSSIPTSNPVKAGYTFGGWWTGDDGTGTQVTDGSHTPVTPYGAVTFYAKWTANTDNAVTWDDEGAETPSSGGSATYTTGSAVSSIPTSNPVKAGYTFGGWWTGDDGTGTQVTDGSYTPVTPYGAVTFYAKWTADS